MDVIGPARRPTRRISAGDLLRALRREKVSDHEIPAKSRDSNHLVDSDDTHSSYSMCQSQRVAQADSPMSAPALVSFNSPTAMGFPLLDLPLELQRHVLYHALGGSAGYDITLEYERLTMLRSRFHILGIPSVNLLLASKHIFNLAHPLRQAQFTGRLILNSVFILVPLRRQDRFQWLRNHTKILHFSDSSVHPERWSRYFDSFANLQRLEIDFAVVKKLEFVPNADGDGQGLREAMTLERVLQRKEDEALLASLDSFRIALVEQLRSGKLDVVVKQMYALPGEAEKGTIVVAEIRLSDHGAELISCRHESQGRPDWNDLVASTRKPLEPVRANGNVFDQGSHQSLWEWHQAMRT